MLNLTNHKNHNDLYVLLLCVIVLAFLFLRSTVGENNTQVSTSMPLVSAYPEELVRSLEASHVYAYDITTDTVLFEMKPASVVPLASLAKVMTAIVVAERIPRDATIYISERAIQEEGSNGLTAGSYWERDELLSFMLLESSNDAAYAFAEAYTTYYPDSSLLEEMNNTAALLNLSTLRFSTVSGLDKNGTPGALGSAEQIAYLLRYAWEHHAEIFEATTQENGLYYAKGEDPLEAHNSNKTILSIPGRLLSKTGMTKMAGGNLGVIVEKGPLHPVVVVVLGSTEYGRLRDTEKVIEYIFSL